MARLDQGLGALPSEPARQARHRAGVVISASRLSFEPSQVAGIRFGFQENAPKTPGQVLLGGRWLECVFSL